MNSVALVEEWSKEKKHFDLFIDGEWTSGSEGRTIDAINPATGEVLAEFVDATDTDVDRAVAAANQALTSWRKTSLEERSRLLLKIADIIEENTARLALIETLDNGKPIRETKAIDVPFSADHFRYFAGVIRAEEGTAQLLGEHTL
ncbi:aldehyde dehydrogenase family protein, partial [Enterococcus sp.]